MIADDADCHVESFGQSRTGRGVRTYRLRASVGHEVGARRVRPDHGRLLERVQVPHAQRLSAPPTIFRQNISFVCPFFLDRPQEFLYVLRSGRSGPRVSISYSRALVMRILLLQGTAEALPRGREASRLHLTQA